MGMNHLSVGYESSQLWVRIVWVRNVPDVCANEAEQQEESMATGVETQTEAFDYLYRKTVRFEAPDKDAETQTEAFDYLYRETGCLEAHDKDAETQTGI